MFRYKVTKWSSLEFLVGNVAEGGGSYINVDIGGAMKVSNTVSRKYLGWVGEFYL